VEDVSSSDSTFDLFSSLTVCGAPAVTVGDARVYLVGYIFYIIDCHICWDIFGRINIMYCRLSYVSECALPLKTLVLYTLYIPAVRYNAIQPIIIHNLFFYRFKPDMEMRKNKEVTCILRTWK
jgi:hypothetical protein